MSQKPRPLRVLLLLHELSRTGAPKLALDALDAMENAVSVVTLALRGGPLEARCRALGLLAVASDWEGGSPVQRLGRRARRKAFVQAMRRWKPDVVYVHSAAALPLARALPLPPAPALLHAHEMGTPLEAFAAGHETLLRDWPRAFVAVSEAARRDLCAHGVVPERIHRVPAFVPDDAFARAATFAPRPPDGRFVVAGAGFPSWCKGTTLWLQTAAELASRLGRDAVRFVWVGMADTPFCRQFREEARLLGLADVVEFVPATPDPYPCLAACDAFAMTSWEDACPLVVLEAMMLQKPVACFAGGGGAPEEVGGAGIVVPEFTPAQMAAAFAELADNPARRAQIGAAARARVQEHFLASVQAPRLLALLREVAARGVAAGEGV